MQIKNIAMKKSILLFVLVTLFTCSFAINPVVTVNEAKQTAANFLNEQCYINAKSIHLTLQEVKTDEDGEPLYYRFQLNNLGFVIVSANKNYYPILAFSYESNFKESEESLAICEGYKNSIKKIKDANAPVNANVAKAWNHFNRENFTKAKDSVTVNECQPLLTTSWGQTKYYNQYCPFDGNANVNNTRDHDFRTTVGSAGLAMASILNYYRYPTQGYGGISYISSNDWGETYPRIFLNLNEVTYNYDAMTSSLDSSYNGEVAKLLFHTGATAYTKYSAEKNSSYITTTNPDNVFEVFKQYWGISTDSRKSYRSYPSYYEDSQHLPDQITEIERLDSIWIAENVIPELDERRPVFYSGYNKEKHTYVCFVVDGYKYLNVGGSQGNTVFLHVNLAPTFSFGEMEKAYYMYCSDNFKYKHNESVIRNLQPAELNIEKPVTSETVLTAKSGTISDGAGNMMYSSNSNRVWEIAAPNATSYTFTFKRLNTEANNDVVRIYSGSEANEANLERTFSGQHLSVAATDSTMMSAQPVTFDLPTLPESFTISASTVLVTFTSNDTIEDYGFVLEYSCTYDQSDISACDSAQTLTGSHYIIIDKEQPIVTDDNEINNISSADEPYAAEHICSWTVATPYAQGYYFSFRKFDLRAGDFIEITTNSDNPKLLQKFDVFNMPSAGYTVDVKSMKVRFVTDHWQEGDGFELDYWTLLGINQESGLSDISIYPNPATNFINVELTGVAQNISVKMVDMSGKVMYNDVFSHNGGTQIYKVPVTDMASGIYFLHMNTPTGQTIQKVVVR